jgi:acetyl esterase
MAAMHEQHMKDVKPEDMVINHDNYV